MMRAPANHTFRYDNFFLVNPVAMAVVNLKGRVLIGNHALEKLLRHPLAQVTGECISCFFPEQEKRQALLSFLAAAGDTMASMETECVTGEGTPLPVLISVVTMGDNGALVTLENLAERQAMRKRLEYLTYFDPLTGLANVRLLENRLEQAILRAARTKLMVAVFLFDLRRFKKVSESFDRMAGDILLREAGERISSCLRKTDTVARYQGDKFAVLMEGLTATDPVLRIIRGISHAFEHPFSVEDQEIFLNAKAGIAFFPPDGEDAETLLKNAETALHGAKEQGRGYLFYTPEMNARARERLRLESDLFRAVESGNFEVFFQPQIDALQGRVWGMEALLRWQHPKRGHISPLEFIPVLEETGKILRVDRWVLRQACLQIRAWQRDYFPDLRIGVNLSARQFQDPDFVPFLGGVLEETGLEPSSLILEITESLLMRDTEESSAILSSFAGMGVQIAIDDFGTGFSSLAYLKRFPVHTIKIDRNFVQGIPNSRHDTAIGYSIIALAENLGLQVVAEGVEKKEQFDLLRSWNCRQMQGFLFARPMPSAAFSEWLTRDFPLLQTRYFQASSCRK